MVIFLDENVNNLKSVALTVMEGYYYYYAMFQTEVWPHKCVKCNFQLEMNSMLTYCCSYMVTIEIMHTFLCIIIMLIILEGHDYFCHIMPCHS